ncbi:MAG: YkvA family protein [Rhodanobacteraceae bacterium]
MPTRLDFDANRSVARLDLSPAQSGIFTPGIEAIDITEGQLRRFNELARALNEAMPALTADQVSGVARRVLRTAATGGQSPFIASRMRRAAEMRALSAEAAWTSAEVTARRIHDLIAYLDDPNDLIRDDIPVIGRLDDALLVDIAMDTLREEVEDYAEFRRYRFAEASRRGVGIEALDLDRPRWQVEREDELRLERQLRRVRGSDYAASAAERVFRVC